MNEQTLPNREGQTVPDVTFRLRRHGEWATVTTDELFGGKNVIVFSLPGAFTPTCSSTHLPRYNELAPVFREKGIDSIICVAVNDPFVMEEWGKDQEAENVLLLPDGNGAFTEAMGLLVDKSDLNFGKRSWRYSMLVRDGIIDKMFIEADKEGDPFEVSDAETMLKYINPQAKKPEPVVMFSKPGCPHCARAKAVLRDNNVPFTDISQDKNISTAALRAVSGQTTWPQVFMGGKLIGDADVVEAYFGKSAPSSTGGTSR